MFELYALRMKCVDDDFEAWLRRKSDLYIPDCKTVKEVRELCKVSDNLVEARIYVRGMYNDARKKISSRVSNVEKKKKWCCFGGDVEERQLLEMDDRFLRAMVRGCKTYSRIIDPKMAIVYKKLNDLCNLVCEEDKQLHDLVHGANMRMHSVLFTLDIIDE